MMLCRCPRRHHHHRGATPETYLGYGRAARFAGRADGAPKAGSGFLVDRPWHLPPDDAPQADLWSYDGEWTVERDRAIAGRNARLLLRYRSRDVYLVMSPPPGQEGDPCACRWTARSAQRCA